MGQFFACDLTIHVRRGRSCSKSCRLEEVFMKKQLVLAFAFGVVAIVSLTTAVHALTVQIDGTTIPTDTGDPLTVTLSNTDGSAKSQGCFTVEAYDKTLSSPNNRARIRALDSSQDTLIFDNAWIKATSANCFKEIYAWHTFSQPPTTSGTNGIRFKRLVDAKALKSSGAAAAGDEMWATGWVPNTPISEIGLTYYRKFPVGDPNFNNTQQEDCVQTACAITGQRDMKWWLKFNLKLVGDQIKPITLKVFTEIVSGGDDSLDLPRGAKVGPYESFADDEPCEREKRSDKEHEKKEHEKKDDQHDKRQKLDADK